MAKKTSILVMVCISNALFLTACGEVENVPSKPVEAKVETVSETSTSPESEYTVDYLVENREVLKGLLPDCQVEYAKTKEMTPSCENAFLADKKFRENMHDVSNAKRMKTKPLFGEEDTDTVE